MNELSCKWRDNELFPFPLILSNNNVSTSLLFSSPLPFSSPFALYSQLWQWGSSVINALNTAAINWYADIVDSLLVNGAYTEIKDEVMQLTKTPILTSPSCILYLIWYSLLFYSILFYSFTFYFTLFYPIKSFSIPFDCTLFHSFLLYSIIFCSNLS